MDLTEWNIKTTSDHCPYFVEVEYFNNPNGEIQNQCDHWDNDSKACLSEKCPIIIKDRQLYYACPKCGDHYTIDRNGCYLCDHND